MNKQQAIENVNGMSPSLVLFTKEQVVEIIESLEQPTVPAENTISREGLHEILMEYGSTMIHKIRKYVDFNDVVDEDTAEFSLCSNEIVLDSVNVDSDKICDEIENSLDLEELASNLIERLFPMSEVMEITITED
jgi:hypothetical protein